MGKTGEWVDEEKEMRVKGRGKLPSHGENSSTRKVGRAKYRLREK
jgi:hypothetical protein